MSSFTLLIVFMVMLSCSVAFYLPASQRPSKLTMLFNFGKKVETPVKSVKKEVYCPPGFTPEQYQAFLKSEEEKKLSKKTKFPKGKEAETLTEWMLKQKEKGLEGKDLNLKGHRMVKCKYEGWYTNESPI